MVGCWKSWKAFCCSQCKELCLPQDLGQGGQHTKERISVQLQMTDHLRCIFQMILRPNLSFMSNHPENWWLLLLLVFHKGCSTMFVPFVHIQQSVLSCAPLWRFQSDLIAKKRTAIIWQASINGLKCVRVLASCLTVWPYLQHSVRVALLTLNWTW